MSRIQYSYSRCPHTRKIHLVEWAMKRFDITKSKANSYNKKQLYAIWYREKDKASDTNKNKSKINERRCQ